MEIKLTSNDLVTVTQTAKALGCARLTIYRWVKSGKITGVDLAGLLFIPKSEVERIKAKGPRG
jgi:excisionase family DNA binding protein